MLSRANVMLSEAKHLVDETLRDAQGDSSREEPIARRMTQHSARWTYAVLAAICLVHCAVSLVGITWGLPSRKIDPLLFGDGPAWTGEKTYRLAHADEKLAPSRVASTGADVDVNPIARPAGPVLLTGTEEDVAKIYLRYRLYTYQPDEMITMMALAGMRPGQLQLDPRLYQYGGLFIYPVGALIKLCGLLGLIDVRTDLVWYLDHPEEFGKFYIVARAYSAAWGLLGVLVVFAFTHRFVQLRGSREGEAPAEPHCASVAALIAALLFVLLPVVVCMSHEGKPHLPGAVLMLLSVYLALRTLDDNRQSPIANRKFFWLTCLACGASVGMVLSSWPICVLIPLTAWFRRRSVGVAQAVAGLALAIAVYFLTNPYVIINVLVNRQVLRSNFGNSLAMYQVSRIGEGLWRVLELTAEGATLPVMILGLLAMIFGRKTRSFRNPVCWLVLAPFLLFSVQFILIGAGKPAEYGRFGIFTNVLLAIYAAISISRWNPPALPGFLVLPILLCCVGFGGFLYLHGFYVDAAQSGSRMQAATLVTQYSDASVVVPVEPAPYSCPPLNFSRTRVMLADDAALAKLEAPFIMVHFDERADAAPISWANKTFWVRPDTTPRTWRLLYTPPARHPNLE